MMVTGNEDYSMQMSQDKVLKEDTSGQNTSSSILS
jgi:hypothetical protein